MQNKQERQGTPKTGVLSRRSHREKLLQVCGGESLSAEPSPCLTWWFHTLLRPWFLDTKLFPLHYWFWLLMTSSSRTASNVLEASSSSLTLGWDFFFFSNGVEHEEKRLLLATPPMHPEGKTQEIQEMHKEKWMSGRIIGTRLTFMPDYLKSVYWGLEFKCK